MKPLLVLALALAPLTSFAAPDFFEKTGSCSNHDCCSFNMDWEVGKKAQVYDLANLKKVVGHVYPAEKVRVLDALTRSEKGTAELKTNTEGFKKGQRVSFYLMESNENLFYLWKSGELTDVEPTQLKVLKPSKFKNYIKLKTSVGIEGWVELGNLIPSC